MRLKDKVIIITGSTTGIGKAIAKAALSEGAKVLIHGLEEDLGQEAIKELGEKNTILHVEDIRAKGCVERLADESGPISGQVLDLEQHPMMGRNAPKDSSTIHGKS